jgi:hypothetical protein
MMFCTTAQQGHVCDSVVVGMPSNNFHANILARLLTLRQGLSKGHLSRVLQAILIMCWLSLSLSSSHKAAILARYC